MKNTAHPFDTLTPGFIMDAVESRGFRCDCRTLALNSYENRVYQVGIEEGKPLIAKFYRPGRWSDAQILEEHRFCLELADHELPVVAPWAEAGGDTLFRHEGFRFALYPRQGGMRRNSTTWTTWKSSAACWDAFTGSAPCVPLSTGLR
jgi:Ser/Thr protein kinase RdoA (MazF antagonist)